MKSVLLKQGDITYSLGSGTGSWAKSFEKGIVHGNTRVIDGILMYAIYIYKKGLLGSLEVNWTPVDEELGKEYTNLRKWMAKY
jgi:hypothetical protein